MTLGNIVLAHFEFLVLDIFCMSFCMSFAQLSIFVRKIIRPIDFRYWTQPDIF